MLPYTVAQVTGATLGSWTSFVAYAPSIQTYKATQGLVRSTSVETARVFGEYFSPANLNWAQAFAVEALGTAILAATAFSLTHPLHQQQNDDNDNESENDQQSASQFRIPIPLVMGATVFGLISALAPLTQVRMNPARDFGPRLVAYAAGWTDVAFQPGWWIYAVAPMIGACLGVSLVDQVLLRQPIPTTTTSCTTRTTTWPKNKTEAASLQLCH